MTAVHIDGMRILDDSDCGGAFRLTEPAAEDRTETLDGWTVEVRQGSEVLVARGRAGSNYEVARDSALAAGNMGLDLMCLRGARALGIRAAHTEHIVGWFDGPVSVLRVRSTPTVVLTVPQLMAVGGAPVVPAAPEWQESARYFRLSQLTNDLVDSFRNVYLAVESILDHITPQKVGSRREGEGEWFRRALAEAGSLVNLSGHAAADAPDPVGSLYQELYVSTRNLVFHAKTSRDYFLPHSPERRALENTTRRAANFYLALAESVTHLRRPQSGWFAGAWRMQIEALATRLKLVVTDDVAAVSADDTAINPSGGALVGLRVTRATEFDNPFEHAFLGVGPGDRVAELGSVTRIGATVDGDPLVAAVPDGNLLVSALGRFEILMVLRGRNATEPKRDFAT